MHDPMTVAFEIKNPFSRAKYPDSIITIWHVDPEIRGNDDSCGWFLRSWHLDQTLMEKVRKEFAFNFKHNYWFNDAGYPKFSVISIVLAMYSEALRVTIIHQNKGNMDWKRHSRFMKKHLYDIIRFAENPMDSLHSAIVMQYGVESQEERIGHFASVITADIFRKERKWWQHPRWHIHHWQIQFHPWQRFKRRYIDKCCICNKRGFTGPAYSDWHGTKIWCDKCEKLNHKISAPYEGTGR